MPILDTERSIIPACDVSLGKLENLVQEIDHFPEISSYKVGFFLAMNYGLPRVVDTIRKHSDKPVIYDHQKAATDIPAMGEKFIDACKRSGVDAVILFPQAGPVTQEAWIKAAQDSGMGVIVGGEMTHPGYLQSDEGYIADDAPRVIY